MVRGFLLAGMVAGWTLSASTLYVVRSPRGVSVFTKDSLGFADTYADTRQWKSEDLAGHRDIVKRMIATDRGDLIAHIGGSKDAKQAEENETRAHHKHAHSHHSDVALDQ